MGPDGPEWGQEDFFPANPDLADILGRTDFDFENFCFLDFLDPKFPDVQVPDFQISRNLAWAKLGPSLGPAWARAWAQAWAQTPPPASPDEFSDPNLTPLPTHPGISNTSQGPLLLSMA